MMLEVGDLVTRSTAGQLCGVSHPYFTRQLTSPLLDARICFGSSATLPGPRSEAAKRGVRFERKVADSLSQSFRTRFVSNLPFSFQTSAKRGKAIPDGLLFTEREEVVLIEVKYQHCADAWWQLERFYLPIVREALRVFRVVPLEICSIYDPWVKLQKSVALVESPLEALEARDCFHPVLATRNGSLQCRTSSIPDPESVTSASRNPALEPTL